MMLAPLTRSGKKLRGIGRGNVKLTHHPESWSSRPR
jgi:hypothetical protein